MFIGVLGYPAWDSVWHENTHDNAHSYGLQWTPVHHHCINPDLPVAIHTQSHQISFQECCTQTIRLHLRPHLPQIWNCIPTPPVSTSLNSPNSTLTSVTLKVSTQSLLFYCWGRPLWSGRNISFVSSLYVLVTLTLRPDYTLACLR